MCPVSPVTFHLSPVTCQLSTDIVLIFLDFLEKKSLAKFGQIGAASRWRVCYQWGLPRLV